MPDRGEKSRSTKIEAEKVIKSKSSRAFSRVPFFWKRRLFATLSTGWCPEGCLQGEHAQTFHLLFSIWQQVFLYIRKNGKHVLLRFFLLTTLIEMNDVINPGKTITKTATAAKKSLKKWNHLLSIFIAIIPGRLLC